MFGFIGKFKNEVVSGFDAVHQRLVTLEAKVEALFNHTQVVETAKAEAAKAENAANVAATVVADVTKTVEDVNAAKEGE